MKKNSIIKTLFLGFGFVLASTSLRVRAQSANEMGDARIQLQKEISLIEHIEPYVERYDLARLYVLKKSSQRVLDSIDKVGLANMQTLREYQVLIVAYRYSEDFFSQISTDMTQKNIAELVRINADIIQARGFDDSPYTEVTGSVFTQMRQLFVELDSLPISDSLRTKIRALTPELGQVLSIAAEGDRPRTFDAAIPLQKKIAGLYPEFNSVAASGPVFEVVLSIQGLNEFYGEFAQIR
jgi:hypothetical protein